MREKISELPTPDSRGCAVRFRGFVTYEFLLRAPQDRQLRRLLEADKIYKELPLSVLSDLGLSPGAWAEGRGDD